MAGELKELLLSLQELITCASYLASMAHRIVEEGGYFEGFTIYEKCLNIVTEASNKVLQPCLCPAPVRAFVHEAMHTSKKEIPWCCACRALLCLGSGVEVAVECEGV